MVVDGEQRQGEFGAGRAQRFASPAGGAGVPARCPAAHRRTQRKAWRTTCPSVAATGTSSPPRANFQSEAGTDLRGEDARDRRGGASVWLSRSCFSCALKLRSQRSGHAERGLPASHNDIESRFVHLPRQRFVQTEVGQGSFQVSPRGLRVARVPARARRDRDAGVGDGAGERIGRCIRASHAAYLPSRSVESATLQGAPLGVFSSTESARILLWCQERLLHRPAGPKRT